jgi:membrane fusion protein, multidrug efflux system
MKKSTKIAVGFTALLSVWVLSGLFTKGKPKLDQSEEAPKDKPSVRVHLSTAQKRSNKLIFRGTTFPNKNIQMKAETSGRIKSIFPKGQMIDKGTVIAILNHEDKKAKLFEAEALFAQRKIEYDAASKLAQQGFRSESKLLESKAQLQTAEAVLKRVQVDLHHTELKAPFKGVLQDTFVDVGDFVTIGTPVAQFIELNPLKSIVYVTEQNISKIKIGLKGFLKLMNGKSFEGVVDYIAKDIDSATKTFKVELKSLNDKDYAAGMTVEVELPLEASEAHLVNPSILALDDTGKIGIKYLSVDNKVLFQLIDVNEDSKEGIWITGLPYQTRIITVGGEYVKVGQDVIPSNE